MTQKLFITANVVNLTLQKISEKAREFLILLVTKKILPGRGQKMLTKFYKEMSWFVNFKWWCLGKIALRL